MAEIEIRFEGKLIEDFSKKTLIKMFKEIFVYAKNLETQLKQRKVEHPDTTIVIR